MSGSPSPFPHLTAGLLRARLAEIAQLVGRSPESFTDSEKHRQESEAAELLAMWTRLDRQDRDRLLEYARRLDDARCVENSATGAHGEHLFTATR